MLDVLKPERLMEDILSSYEQRINGVQSIFDATRLVLTDFQENAAQAREEQDLVSTQLRDVLARNEHLRKKDYDLMIQRIIEPRREQEKEIRALLNEFLDDQQRLAADLQEHYTRIRAQLAKGDPKKILEQLNAIKALLKEQERNKEALTANLREAQADHREMLQMVKTLLVKGNALRIRDFKDMLAHIQNQGQERIARKFKRREEVRRMLAEFKQQRNKDPASPKRYAGTSAADRQPTPACRPLGNMREALEAIHVRYPEQGGVALMNKAIESIAESPAHSAPPCFGRGQRAACGAPSAMHEKAG